MLHVVLLKIVKVINWTQKASKQQHRIMITADQNDCAPVEAYVYSNYSYWTSNISTSLH